MGEKKKSKLKIPNTFRTQVCLNILQIPLCLWCFSSLSGWLLPVLPFSLHYQFQQHKSSSLAAAGPLKSGTRLGLQVPREGSAVS